MATSPTDPQVGVTVFKSHCLSLIDDVAQGKANRIVLLKHNRPIAAVVPMQEQVCELWGAMQGSVTIVPDTDLTLGTDEVWKAES